MAICRECQRIFTPISTDGADLNICEDCLESEEEDFRLIKSYMEGHRNATLMDVVRDTRIPLRRLERLLRSGRIDTKQ